MSLLPSLPVMRRAFAAKDPAFDGTFFVAVKTTGVFCRPVCRARPPREQNVEFFATAAEAVRQGYRPCKLCRPERVTATPPPVVARLMRLVDESPDRRLAEADLREAGIDPSTARRQFRAHCGMTFSAYHRARRLAAAHRLLRRGTDMPLAAASTGFESASGLRQALSRLFGGSAATDQTLLSCQWMPSPLGTMLAIAAEDGVVLLDFIDRKGLPGALQRLRQHHSASIAPADNPHLRALTSQLAEYFAGQRRDFSVALRPHASPFERLAWDYLRAIPFGQTRTYAQQAAGTGPSPSASSCPSGRSRSTSAPSSTSSTCSPTRPTTGGSGPSSPT
jgi:AraC family transcriptional regulator of adaptative response/methylated-DNA-[protein]-cysteine methyltransferase